MNRSNWLLVIFALLVVVLVGFGFKNHFDAKATAYNSISQDVVLEEERVIFDLLSGLRTGGDSYSTAVKVSDCANEERARFDELLSNLGSLDRASILELDNLFNACAYYYSTVQTVSVARLEREVEMYKDVLRVSAVLDPASEKKLEKMPEWDRLVDLERQRGSLHNELVVIQGEIVDEMLNYKQVGHPDVQALIAEANEARENILFLTQQIDEIATSLEEYETTS